MNKRIKVGSEDAIPIPSCSVKDGQVIMIDGRQCCPNRILLIPNQAIAFVHVRQITTTLFGSMDKYLSYRLDLASSSPNSVVLSSMEEMLKNPFAIKTYFKQLVLERKTIHGNDTEEDAFREIEILKTISPHENILCLRGLLEQDNADRISEQLLFALFDYIPLGSLFEFIRDNEATITHECCNDIIQKIAKGLLHLHNSTGIVHCDIDRKRFNEEFVSSRFN